MSYGEMRYTVQIRKNKRWIYDGTYDSLERAKEYAERCFYKEGYDARIVIETIEILEDYIGL